MSRIGILVSALVAALVGVKCLLTGAAGYRAGYAQGTHVRIAGFVLSIVGIGMFVHWIRQVRAAQKPLEHAKQKKPR